MELPSWHLPTLQNAIPVLEADRQVASLFPVAIQ
jgi:hypothetical protein